LPLFIYYFVFYFFAPDVDVKDCIPGLVMWKDKKNCAPDVRIPETETEVITYCSLGHFCQYENIPETESRGFPLSSL
jgi:hypothetical protein